MGTDALSNAIFKILWNIKVFLSLVPHTILCAMTKIMGYIYVYKIVLILCGEYFCCAFIKYGRCYLKAA